MNSTELALKLATERVDTEDQAARSARIEKYRSELMSVLDCIERAKVKGDASIELYSTQHNEVSVWRILESLAKHGYRIGDRIFHQGPWINGAGYASYYSHPISW